MAFIPNTEVVTLIDRTKERQSETTARRGLVQLLTIALDGHALGGRFPIWPEVELTKPDLVCLCQPETWDQKHESMARLLRVGLVQQASTGWQLAVPVYEQVRSMEHQEQVDRLGDEAAGKLVPFIGQLRLEWKSSKGLPEWEQVAHNLVIGFLCGAYASRILLRLYEKTAAALVVTDPGKMQGNWFSVFRVRPDLALVDTVGAAYPDSDLLHLSLQTTDIAQSLASVDAEGRLLMHGDKSLKLLRQLSAYRKTSQGPWLPNDFWLRWPVLQPTMLRQVSGSLTLVCRALKLALGDLKSLLDRTHLPPSLRREDMALSALLDFAGALRAALVSRDILPQPVSPWLSDWQLPDASGTLQAEMLKGIGG